MSAHPRDRLKMLSWEKHPVPTFHARWPLPMGVSMAVLEERLNRRLNEAMPEWALAWTAVDGREGVAVVELRGVDADDPLVQCVMRPLCTLQLDDAAYARGDEPG